MGKREQILLFGTKKDQYWENNIEIVLCQKREFSGKLEERKNKKIRKDDGKVRKDRDRKRNKSREKSKDFKKNIGPDNK